MAVPRDPYLEAGPLPPPRPRDPNRETVLDETERNQDPGRGAVVDEALAGPARPLTDDEEDAAKDDPGRQPRTYAPAEARVPKPPAPGDDRIIEEGLDEPVSTEAARHPGDRSDPAELKRS